MEQKRIKVRLTKNSPYSDYGYYKKGDIGYIDGYVNDNAVIILENGKFAKAELTWIEVVNEEDKNANTELKESEDVRIRKQLIEHTKWSYDEQEISEEEKERWIAWLEKQGQHKKFRDSIQVGDKVTRNEDGVLVNLSQLNRVAKKDEKQGEQKPADKVEPKFHEGDIIIHKELGGDYIHNPHKIIQVDILDKKYRLEGGLVAHFGEQEDYELVEQKPTWSEEDGSWFKELELMALSFSNDDSYRKKFFDWLKSLKDRVQPQPMQEWSQNDINMIDWLIRCCEKEHEELCNDKYGHQDIVSDLKRDCRKKWNWLESLKNKVVPQNRWKPDKAVIQILELIIQGKANPTNYQATLMNLVEQLKNLGRNSYEVSEATI